MRRQLANARAYRKRGQLVHVEARHFVAGLIVHEGVCVATAPILGWALGKRWQWLEHQLRQRGYAVTLLPPAAGLRA